MTHRLSLSEEEIINAVITPIIVPINMEARISTKV
jgi:hypothetical protein